MARKGNSRHVKRLASSRYIKIGRKTSEYVSKQHPGRHTYETSISLITLMKEKIGIVRSSAEARSVIKKGAISVNGKPVKDERYPMGFGDVMHVAPSSETYRVDVAKNGVIKVEKAHEKNERTLKVTGKYLAKGNKIMLRLYDGTIISGSNEVRVNDSVGIKAGRLGEVVKMEKGAKCYVIKGAHASESGIIKEITPGSATRDALVAVESGSSKFETLLENIMVVGK